MSLVRALARLLPGRWRHRLGETLKREYRLGWPAAVSHSSELDLLEVVLAHYAQRHSQIRFLQIGASDGVLGDALFPLVQKYRMSGVLVEPRAAMFERLKRNYAARPEDFIFVNAAIMRRDGTENLYSIRDFSGAPDAWQGTASFDKQVVLRALHRHPDPESMIVVEPVKTISVETLFQTYPIGPIDLLQIDVEGFDAEIIEMFDIKRRRPAIVRFEHMHLNWKQYDSVLRLLAANSYRIGISQFDALAYLTPPSPDRRSPSSL
jgi:FkbM family methyltransferase